VNIAAASFSFLFAPSNSAELATYYLLWISLFLGINVVWDIFTSRTPNFHLDRLTEKGDVLFSAASFCSSLLIIVGFFSHNVQQLSRDTMVPLILAGCSGLIKTIPAICPYKKGDGLPPED
jgi:hypothetical protein